MPSDFLLQFRDLGLSGVGLSPEQIDSLETKLGVSFPAAYRAFLQIMGWEVDEALVGSDCNSSYIPRLREWAEELLKESKCDFRLPSNAVVFLMHQGNVFLYFMSDGNDDPAVYRYLEYEQGPTREFEHFSDWLKDVKS
jgi:hypothetical protein